MSKRSPRRKAAMNGVKSEPVYTDTGSDWSDNGSSSPDYQETQTEQFLPITHIKMEPDSGATGSDDGFSIASSIFSATIEQLPCQMDYLKTEGASNIWSNSPVTFEVTREFPGRVTTFDGKDLYNYPSSSISSWVWKYFMFMKKEGVDGPPTRDNLNMEVTVCTLCNRVYKFIGNTTNMRTHLRHSHLEEWDDNEMPKPQKVYGSLPKSSNSSEQTSVAKPIYSVPKPNYSQGKQVQLQDALMKLLIMKSLPISMVDNKYFREFAALLDPKYDLPTGELVTKWLGNKERMMALAVKTEVAPQQDVAITYDGWTGVTDENYCCVTAHFITQDWLLREVALQVFKMESTSTTESVAEILEMCRNYWVPQANIVGVSGSASVEKQAFERLNWRAFGCFGHKINLMARKVVSSCDEVNQLVGKARRLVTNVQPSSPAKELLRNKRKWPFAEEDMKLFQDLKSDCMTQWNSAYEILKKVTEIRPALTAMVMNDDIPKSAKDTLKDCVYSVEEQTLAAKVVLILECFQKVTLSLCAEQVPTVHKVLPVIIKLRRVLQPSSDDPAVLTELKKTLKADLELVQGDDDDDVHALTTVLNPFTKSLCFLPEEQRNRMRQLLKDKVKILLQETAEKDGDMVEPAAKKSKCNKSCADLDDWMSDILSEASADQTSESSGSSKDGADALLKARADNEVSRYLGVTMPEGQNISILQWWRANAPKYPNVSKLARKYLALPASSISQETIFKLTGNAVSTKRAGLSPETVNTFVFLNKNMKYW